MSLEIHIHRTLNILYKRVEVKTTKHKGHRKFTIIRDKHNKALMLWHIKIAGLIKTLRILFHPQNKHDKHSRSAILMLQPDTIQHFYADQPDDTNKSWVYEYGRLGLTYCGVSKLPMRRIWQHICMSRKAFYGSQDSSMHYQRTAHINCDSMFSLTPLAYVPNRIREHVESNFVSNMPFNLNYAKNISHKQVSEGTNKLGIRCRFKKTQAPYIPTIYSTYSKDLYHFSCTKAKHYNVKLDDLLTILCTTSNTPSIEITAGCHDATDWSAIDILFGDTIIAVNNTKIKLKHPAVKHMIHKGYINKMQIDEWHCDAAFAHTKLTFSKIIASLRNIDHNSKVARLYSYLNLTDKLCNARAKSQALNCVHRAFKHFQIKAPPKKLFVRTEYEIAVSRKQLCRAVRYIVGATDLPASAQRVILGNTSLVKGSGTRVSKICCNGVYWASKWSLHKPWDHSNLCKEGNHKCRSTYGESCMAFRADEYHGVHSTAVNTNLNVTPAPNRQSVFHGLVTGLMSFLSKLQNFCSIDMSITKIKELATRCNIFSQPDQDRYCTTKSINQMTDYFSDCVRHGLDKNTNMLFISCKRFHWHLLYTTFQFVATGSPCNGLNYAVSRFTKEEYIYHKQKSYAWSHIAQYKQVKSKSASEKVAKADAVQKFAKEKARPMVRCHREPERLLKHRICRAGFYVLVNAGLDQFGIFQTRLVAYKDRWALREEAGDSAATLKKMDDMSGFYTSLDRAGVLVRAKYCIDKYKSRFRKNKHWLNVPIRGGDPVCTGKSCEGRVNIHIDEIYDVLVWASNYSSFALGEHFLEQLLGLFQGCALSVILSLMCAAADEDKWLTSIGDDRKYVSGVRYFDDRWILFMYFLDCFESKRVATKLHSECSKFYMEGIVCEPEPPPHFLESSIFESNDGLILLFHNNKNWDTLHSENRQKIITQMPRSCYAPTSVINGHRMSRLRSIVAHSNTLEGKISSVIQMITEWIVCLGDDMADVRRIMKRLYTKKRKPVMVWHLILKIIDEFSVQQLVERYEDPAYESDCSHNLLP